MSSAILRYSAWDDAVQVALLLATNPAGLGGVSVRAGAGPVRDRWLALYGALMAGQPLRRVPLHINDERLIGGLDLAATLQRGRPVAAHGLLAEANGGAVVLAMAERLAASTVSRLTAVLDTGELVLERDGVSARNPVRLGVVALDEGLDDEHVPAALLDRLAFLLDLSELSHTVTADPVPADWVQAVATARPLMGQVEATEAVVQVLCQTAVTLGIDSLRTALLAVQVARTSAALAGRRHTEADDANCAARLVLAPRATVIPPPEPPDAADTEPPHEPDTPEPDSTPAPDVTPPPEPAQEPVLEDQVLQAARAAIPAGLLARLQQAELQRQRGGTAGKAGALQSGGLRGRPAGVRAGTPDHRVRLNVIETLRAAAPWQRLRQAQRAQSPGPTPERRVEVRSQDFRVTHNKQRTATTTLFVVDASGSAALTRLAETKGAVELLLADCYVRRDRVAVLAFRGTTCELLLPPTRSLVRAKRSLAGLPGGGGTPLAQAIETVTRLALAIQKKGETPVIVLLTDGMANVNRLGRPGRAEALQDALASAAELRATGMTVLLVDTSPRSQPQAQALASAMRAVYLPLPYAGPVALSEAVKATTAGLAPSR